MSRKLVSDYLTNRITRSWRFKEFVSALGNGCKGEGQKLLFSSDGNVTQLRCIDGRSVSVTTTWMLQPVGDMNAAEWALVFGTPLHIHDTSTLFVVRVDLLKAQLNKKGTELRLRSLPQPSCPACPRQLITFLSID